MIDFFVLMKRGFSSYVTPLPVPLLRPVEPDFVMDRNWDEAPFYADDTMRAMAKLGDPVPHPAYNPNRVRKLVSTEEYLAKLEKGKTPGPLPKKRVIRRFRIPKPAHAPASLLDKRTADSSNRRSADELLFNVEVADDDDVENDDRSQLPYLQEDFEHIGRNLTKPAAARPLKRKDLPLAVFDSLVSPSKTLAAGHARLPPIPAPIGLLTAKSGYQNEGALLSAQLAAEIKANVTVITSAMLADLAAQEQTTVPSTTAAAVDPVVAPIFTSSSDVVGHEVASPAVDEQPAIVVGSFDPSDVWTWGVTLGASSLFSDTVDLDVDVVDVADDWALGAQAMVDALVEEADQAESDESSGSEAVTPPAFAAVVHLTAPTLARTTSRTSSNATAMTSSNASAPARLSAVAIKARPASNVVSRPTR